MALKRTVSKQTAKKTARPKPAGVVTHYYGGIGVGIVKCLKPVKTGMPVRFSGATTDFTQTIQSLQYEHEKIVSAAKGKEVGMKVKKRVREGDEMFFAE